LLQIVNYALKKSKYAIKKYYEFSLLYISKYIFIKRETFFHSFATDRKTRFVVGKYAHLGDVLLKTYKTGGPSAFFKGFWPNTISIFLFTGLDLITYEHIKHWQFDHNSGGMGAGQPKLI